MNPRLRRILIPIIVLAVSAFIVLQMFKSAPTKPAVPDNSQAATNTDSNPSDDESPKTDTPTADSDSLDNDSAKKPAEPITSDDDVDSNSTVTKYTELKGLKAVAPASQTTFDESWLTLGSLDRRQAKVQINLTA